MCPGLSDDPLKIDDTRMTAIIDREILRLNIDIAGLQEIRVPGAGSLRERNYTQAPTLRGWVCRSELAATGC